MANIDVLVVGAGPAGLATAIAASQLGLKVAVVDARRPPIDKACGEGLMPDGVAALNNLGVYPTGGELAPFRGIRFISDGLEAEAPMTGAPGLGIRRPVLHRCLAERAAHLGIVMRWGTRVESIQAGAVRAGDSNVACKWIVGADGHNSLVRRLARLGSAAVRQRIGVSQHYSVQPWTDFVEVYWHRRGQAYVTPVAAGMMNVVLMGNGENLRIPDLAELFPRLAERLKGTNAVGSPYSGVTASFVLESVIREHVALVGDASGSVDAVTGEGLSLAFRQALALAAGLRDNDLKAYQSAHRRMIRPPRMMAALLLTMGSREWLLRRAVHALATHSTAFARLMAIHSGEISPSALKIREVAGLFWRLVTASGDTPRGIEAL